MGLSEEVAAVGFDSNVVSVGMLETGEMDALIVQNPFAIGYLGAVSYTHLDVYKRQPLDESLPQDTIAKAPVTIMRTASITDRIFFFMV